MKLYSFPTAPNPMRVELMLKYKGVQVETEHVDLRNGEQLQAAYRKINPRCTAPALLLDDGTLLTEVIAICLYLDSQFPGRPVFGSNDSERAQVVNWMHRIFTDGFMAAAEALRNSSPGMKDRALPGPQNLEQIPALAERGRQRLPGFFEDLNDRLEGRDFIVGDALSQADIDAFVVCSFAGWIKIQPAENLSNVAAWRERVGSTLEA
ncbi:MAG: glutathione S-transferase family protein [Salinisphaeraceae bacterium]|nr:glutathione S-transferase family protein [Salinisphaeraceae bacterium]